MQRRGGSSSGGGRCRAAERAMVVVSFERRGRERASARERGGVSFGPTQSRTQLVSLLTSFLRGKLGVVFTHLQGARAERIVRSIDDMFSLCWTRPSPEEQKNCISKSGSFNYDSRYRGLSWEPLSSFKENKELSGDGFSLNHARTLVGSGIDCYKKGKEALQTWRHFGLDWAFVDPKTPTKVGAKFCVCVKEIFPWIMMPLQVVYVNEITKKGKSEASFGFGSGTLHGHLLAGEERFSIELDENNQVWYEILSFSKPAHILSVIGFPYVRLMQRYFAHQSTSAVKKHLSA